MARLHGSKNRKTLLREAEEALEHPRAPHEIADSVCVMESAMMYFYTLALSKKHLGKPEAEVNAAMKDALMAAERVAPFRHPKLGAVKLAGDVNNPLRMLDTASKDELKAEIVRHLKILAPVLELDAVPELRGLAAPADESADLAEGAAGIRRGRRII